MPKQRMTALDIRAAVNEMRSSIVGLRVANIYDLNNRLYVLKLSKAEMKKHLIMEAGHRCHLSDWKRDKNALPSHFCLRLRKFLRTKRIEGVRQLGADRIIDIQCGLRENALHLIVEFYVFGNVILTNSNYEILVILRRTNVEQTGKLAIGQVYPQDKFSGWSTLISPVLLEPCIQGGGALGESVEALSVLRTLSREYVAALNVSNDNVTVLNMSNNDNKKPSALADLCRPMLPFAHPGLVAHAVRKASLNPSFKRLIELPLVEAVADAEFELVVAAVLDECLGKLREVSADGSLGYVAAASRPIRGYAVTTEILIHKDDKHVISEVLDDFTPIILSQQQAKQDRIREYSTFNEAVDAFFGSQILHDEQKVEAKQQQTKLSKVEKIKLDQFSRVEKLELEQQQNEIFAERIETNLDLVDNAINMMRMLVGTGADWNTIAVQLKQERKKSHPLATHVHKLDLACNRFDLLLAAEDNEAFGEEEAPLLAVPVDLTLSAFGNVERLHRGRKNAKARQEKTLAAATLAIKKAEKQTKRNQDVFVQKQQGMQRVRQPLWFEKFNWFVSSENYLVISGRDAIQNDILFKKHLKKNDIYIHADVHGAASCVVKNQTGNPVPPTTLAEAGQMSVCRSAAWKSKIVTSAWWVFAFQVSKTPPPGEYLSRGGFMIRGKRNFLPPMRLEMGFAFMYVLVDDSVARHLGERAVSTPSPQLAEASARVMAHADMIHEPEMIRLEDVIPQTTKLSLNKAKISRAGRKAKKKEKGTNLNPVSKPRPAAVHKGKKEEKWVSLITGGEITDEMLSGPNRGSRTANTPIVEAVPEPPYQKPDVGILEAGEDMDDSIKDGVLKAVEDMDDFIKDGILKAVEDMDDFIKDGILKAVDMSLEVEAIDKNLEVEADTADQEANGGLDHSAGELDRSDEEDVEADDAVRLIDADVTGSTEWVKEPRHKKTEKKEIQQLLEEEGDFVDSANLDVLNTLTGIPSPEDTLRGVVPVCSPLSALHGHLYKHVTKLVPGKSKKGLIVRHIMKAVLDDAASDAERALLKTVAPADMHNALVTDATIVNSSKSAGTEFRGTRKGHKVNHKKVQRGPED